MEGDHHRDIEADRHKNTEADQHKGREADRQTDRKTADIETESQTATRAVRQTESQ